ncbi:MAG: AsmA-like C-terminal region-containing protein [Paludibacter sp.]|nr:AsmA-like C-terminal region-containing protein [Paludibacter sp.]
MRKFLKIAIIFLSSLLAVCLIAVSILTWFIFTPEKLTPIVRNELNKMLICESELGNVELTFFSTFPNFGVQIDGVLLTNHLEGAPSDTLLNCDNIIATIDLKTLWNNNELIVQELFLENPFILAYIDSTGRANYDIMKPVDDADTTAFELPFRKLLLDEIRLKNARIIYHDVPMDMVMSLHNLNAGINMKWQDDEIVGKMKGDSEAFSLYWKEMHYLKDVDLKLDTPFSFDAKTKKLQFPAGSLALNKLNFAVDALIQNRKQTDDMLVDIAFKSEKLPIKPVFDLLYLPYEEYLEGISIDGSTYINGTLKGVVSDSLLPVFALNANFSKSDFAYEGLDYKLFDISGKTDIEMDMNDSDLWFVKVYDFDGKTGKSRIAGSAYIDQLMEDMRFDINANANINLVDAKPMLPDDMPFKLQGMAKGDAKIKFLYSQFQKNEFDKMTISGKFKVKDLVADYDTITLRSQAADLAFTMPNNKNNDVAFIELDIASNQLNMLMGANTQATLQGVKLLIATSNPMNPDPPLAVDGVFEVQSLAGNMDDMTALLSQPKGNFSMLMDMQDSTSVPVFDCTFNIKQFTANMDTIAIDILNPVGSVFYHPDPVDVKRPAIQLEYRSDQLSARMGDQQIDTKKISIDGNMAYDASQENVMMRWIPKGFVKLQQGRIKLPDVSSEILIPAIDFDFSSDEYLIRDSRLIIGKSDFQLTGRLTNVTEYLKDEGLLKGDFNFRSNLTDVNHLMNLTNGLGYDEAEVNLEVKESKSPNGSSGPFMVPKGIDISLYTSINEALYANDTARNVQGNITIKDGLLVFESMLFTTSAAKMQLTGMYSSPRKNHLFMGLDLHLLEIEIAELLDLIPDVDSIMPMLRSFGGKGEFHIAIETYLDSAYNLKKSTLRGVSSVRGQNLVLMDGETFTEIAKKLRFNKKTENKVDSLSAEFTIFRNEIDIYPFLIVMDKYKAVVEGKHNLDMNFDYHISVTESPLPFQLGVDVKGNLDDMKVNLAKCKYANMYRPAYRNEVDVKKLELRKMIRDALTDRVKEE